MELLSLRSVVCATQTTLLFAALCLATCPTPATAAPDNAPKTPNTPAVAAPAPAPAPAPATPSAAATAAPAVSPATNGTTLDDAALKNLSREEIRTLARIIRFSPEQLASLRKSFEYLEKMSPEEKQTLLKKLDAMRQAPNPAPPSERPPATGTPPPPRNNLLTLFWDSFPKEKADAEREKFRKMPPRERRTYAGEVFVLTRYWASLSPENARAERTKYQGLDEAARHAYVAEASKKLPPRRTFSPRERENRDDRRPRPPA